MATLCAAICVGSCGRGDDGPRVAARVAAADPLAAPGAPGRPDAPGRTDAPGRPGVGDVTLGPGAALLIEGSAAVSGLPGFGRNAFKGLRGVYAYRPDAGEARYALRVWYTSEPLLLGDGWAAVACPRLPSPWRALAAAAHESAPEGSSFWALSSGGTTLLMEFPEDMPEPCRFAAALVDRFAFFSRYAQGPGDLSFPATLEVGR